jgi:hypothetical protein
MAHAFRMSARRAQAGRDGYVKREPQPDTAAAWREAVAAGVASRMADRIVRERPMPDRLAAALGQAPVMPEAEIDDVA